MSSEYDYDERYDDPYYDDEADVTVAEPEGPVCGCSNERRLLYLAACSKADWEMLGWSKQFQSRYDFLHLLDVFIKSDEESV